MTQQTFGGELRRLREQRGLSLKKFAKLVHYDPGYLSKVENGLKPPTAPLAARCDAELDADGALSELVPAQPARKSRSTGHEIRIPMVIDGQPMLLPVGVNGQLSGRADGNCHRAAPTDLCGTLSRGLPGSSVAMIVSGGGMTWQWELPGGRAFGGAAFPVHLVEASWSTQHAVVIADQRLRSMNEFVGSTPRSVIIAGTPDGSGASPVLLDAVAARTQICNRALTIPQAFQVDDLTLGILWALSNLDEALLNDDGNLTQARRCLRNTPLDHAAILRDALTGLSPSPPCGSARTRALASS
ncbi:MAG: helix-turn-helix domain-containing protein [Pseudonocardiaceae bacterium]